MSLALRSMRVKGFGNPYLLCVCVCVCVCLFVLLKRSLHSLNLRFLSDKKTKAASAEDSSPASPSSKATADESNVKIISKLIKVTALVLNAKEVRWKWIYPHIRAHSEVLLPPHHSLNKSGSSSSSFSSMIARFMSGGGSNRIAHVDSAETRIEVR